MWKVTTPYRYTVEFMRKQLPVGSDYYGLPWCRQNTYDDELGRVTQWAWGRGMGTLVVLVEDAGSVNISRRSDWKADC